jgi:hypothetical protein
MPSYLASKMWEKVGLQELHSTPYKREIDTWWYIFGASNKELKLFMLGQYRPKRFEVVPLQTADFLTFF